MEGQDFPTELLNYAAAKENPEVETKWLQHQWL